MRIALVIALVTFVTGVATAQAENETKPPTLEDWWKVMGQTLDEFGAAHRIVPPVAVPVRWHARRVWKGKVVGDVLDVSSGDLNGNGKSEIVVLTTDSLVIMSRSRGLFEVRVQAELKSAPASLRSRDPMGTISLASYEADPSQMQIRVRSSNRSHGELYRYVEGELIFDGNMDGYPICEQGVVFASPGRNYFLGKSGTLPGRSQQLAPKLYNYRCQRGKDPTGHPVTFLSEVNAAGVLRIHCEGEKNYCRGVAREYSDVGVAHMIADINNDGYPETITSGQDLTAPGDSIFVYSQESHKQRLLFDKSFTEGVVGISAGDFDGDGSLDAVGVTRTRGSGRMAVWLLN